MAGLDIDVRWFATTLQTRANRCKPARASAVVVFAGSNCPQGAPAPCLSPDRGTSLGASPRNAHTVAVMGHHLYVWEGPMPRSDTDAEQKLTAVANEDYVDGQASPPSERMAGFLAEMLSIWPEPDGDLNVASPWKFSVTDDVSGRTWHGESVFSEWRIATAVVAAIAEKRGLNWVDPQYPEIQAGIRAIWDRHPSVIP